MNNIQKHSDKTFEDIKHINEYGAEYWLARELAPVLEYTQWRNFFSVIEKAVEACANSGFNDDDHFADVSKMVIIVKTTVGTSFHSLFNNTEKITPLCVLKHRCKLPC